MPLPTLFLCTVARSRALHGRAMILRAQTGLRAGLHSGLRAATLAVAAMAVAVPVPATVTLAAALAPVPAAAAGPVPPDALPRHCANPPEYPSDGPFHAKLHINQLKGAWGFSRVGEAGKDANGYPTALPDGPSTSRILRVDLEMAGIAPYAGRFRLYGRGTGQFSLKGALKSPVTTARLPRREIAGTPYWYVDFDYTPRKPRDLIQLQITGLPVRGDHIRDLSLVHHSHLEAFEAGARFMPEVVADLARFGRDQYARTGRRGALRYMQMLHANQIQTTGQDWLAQTEAQRDRRFVGPDFYSFVRMQNNGAKRGEKLLPTALPIEDVVALANATGTDIWYTLAVDILDTRARSLAEYVRDHLDPDLRVFWEYGNELWNSANGFSGYQYAKAHGEAKFPALAEASAVYEWDVYRGMQLFAQIRDVFAATPARARYVAAFWAMAASNRDNGKPRPKSYAGRYFAATLARAEPDIGALPEEIITDMAVGGYVGSPNKRFTRHLMENFDSDADRVTALENYVMLGADGDLAPLRPRHLKTPREDLDPARPIGAYGLLREDIVAGLDPFTGLAQVLRLEEAELQYRGALAPEWTTVARFAAPPAADSVAAMVAAGQLMGNGRKFYGSLLDGSNFQLANVLKYRVAAHAAFAAARGLEFHFYEAGVSTDGAPGSDADAAEMFMDLYHYGGAAGRVVSGLIARAGPEVAQICWYKSHNRFLDGYRGLKRWYGEDPATAPKWRAVMDSIDAAAP